VENFSDCPHLVGTKIVPTYGGQILERVLLERNTRRALSEHEGNKIREWSLR